MSRRMANLRQRVDMGLSEPPSEGPSGHPADAAAADASSTAPHSQHDSEEASQRQSMALLEEAASNLYQV